MGTTVRVIGGSHRRADGTVFERGDVFEATADELDAFGDKFQPVEEGESGDYTATSPGAEDFEAEAGYYRLVAGGTHRTQTEAGEQVVIEEGDIVYLTEREVDAFGDKFECVEEDVDGAADPEEADADEDDTEAAAFDEGDWFDTHDDYQARLETVESGDVDAHLETIIEIETSDTVAKAAEERLES
jgi:hypothetical protein